MEEAETHYLDRGGVTLGYHTYGRGASAVLFLTEINTHFDLVWSDPDFYALAEVHAAQIRGVVLQRRGLGISDPVPYVPSIEQQTEDALAVMDDAGLERATVFGMFSTAGAAALLAATYPERVRNIVLLQPWVTGPLADASVEQGAWDPAIVPEYVGNWRAAFAQWGSGHTIGLWDRNQATPYNRRLMAMLERCSATPAVAQATWDWGMSLDLSDVYTRVRVPTRVLRLPGSSVPEAPVRRAAELIEGAEYIVLPETAPGSSMGEAFTVVVDRTLETLGDPEHRDHGNRFFGIVLFTDLAQSTELLSRIGDARYGQLRAQYERNVRLYVERGGGRLVNVSGDGTLSVFQQPSDAVLAAKEICASVVHLGVAVRAGVHAGEMERAALDVTGLTVHIGARVAAQAAPGEVLVSRTVRELTLGSDLTYDRRGEFTLKGIDGMWELYAVNETARVDDHALAHAPQPTGADWAAMRMAQRAPRLARGMFAAGNAWQRRRAKGTTT